MTEKPILFSTEMIGEILAGRKTQTRRLMKPQPERIPEADEHICGTGWWWSSNIVQSMVRLNDGGLPYLSPYGNPGGHDPGRLWVREAHAIVPRTADAGSTDDGVNQLPHRVSPDGTSWAVYRQGWTRCKPGKWRPSIHMPRWASRLTLDVKSIRAERLQDITPNQIIAEGFPRTDPRRSDVTLRSRFAAGWDKLNGKRPAGSWSDNPWVWVINFEVSDAN